MTHRHGAIFAAELCNEALSSGGPYEAFGATGVIQWPSISERGVLDTSAMVRYKDIEDEIPARIFDAVRNTVAEAFVRIAREVIERERAKDRRP